MQIVFYKNNSDTNKLNKSLSPVLNVQGHLKEGCSIIKPVIKLKYNAQIANGANYAAIPDFGRYYFISGSPVIDGDTMIIALSVDVLMSFKTDILNADVIAKRSSNRFNRYLRDDYIIPVQNYKYKTSRFQRAFTPESGKYILTVGG